MILGIDIGTSYSSAAALINGKIRLIKAATGASAFGDSYSVPTAVFAGEAELLLGQAAFNRRRADPSRFKSEFKRDFGTTSPYLLGGTEYLPEQFYTAFIKHFKQQAEEQTGERVEQVILTHPANYGNAKKRLLEAAAQNAGVFDITLLDEPTAAATGYAGEDKIGVGDILLVYDLGGGTFDTAVIKKTANGYTHLTESLGISQCGGMDFDREVYEDVMAKLATAGRFNMEVLKKEKRFTAIISETCVQVKHQLSQGESHTEPVAVGFDYFDYMVTREEFESRIQPLVQDTCTRVLSVLRNAGLVAGDIDKILLVGGSTRVPLVRRMVGKVLGRDLSFDADPELAICRGAALAGMAAQEGNKADKKSEKKEEKKPEVKPEIKAKPTNQSLSEDKTPSTNWPPNISPTGTTPGNLANGGYIAYQDGWLYANLNDNLYKIRPDGTEKMLLSADNARSIHVIDNWIYCAVLSDSWQDSSIVKIRTDGADRQEFANAGLLENYYIFIEKDWIYYKQESFDGLCRISLDGTKKETVCGEEEGIALFSMYDSVVFYSNLKDRCKLYKMSIENPKGVLVGPDSAMKSIPQFDGEWLYYKKWYDQDDDRKLYRIRPSGSGRQQLTIKSIADFAVSEGKVFLTYDGEDGRLYCLTQTDAGIKTIDWPIKDFSCYSSYFHIIDEWVYYFDDDGDDLYRVPVGGGESVLVSGVEVEVEGKDYEDGEDEEVGEDRKFEDRKFAKALVDWLKEVVGRDAMEMIDEEDAPTFVKLSLKSGEYPLAGCIYNGIGGNIWGFTYTNKGIITAQRNRTDSIDYADVRTITRSKWVIVNGECKMQINGVTVPMFTSIDQRKIDKYIKFTEDFVLRFKDR